MDITPSVIPRYNLANYYLLPLTGLTKDSFGPQNFKNAYCNKDGLILIQVESRSSVTTAAFSEAYVTDFTEEDGSCAYFVYRMPQFTADVLKFRQGLYSRMSEPAKELIRKLMPLMQDNVLLRVLDRDPELREQLSQHLDSPIDPEHELKSPPNPLNFMEI